MDTLLGGPAVGLEVERSIDAVKFGGGGWVRCGSFPPSPGKGHRVRVAERADARGRW